jgi:hypothetical protein
VPLLSHPSRLGGVRNNYHRPHGGLGGQRPYERLKQKTTAQA